jgi:hypothetical protein
MPSSLSTVCYSLWRSVSASVGHSFATVDRSGGTTPLYRMAHAKLHFAHPCFGDTISIDQVVRHLDRTAAEFVNICVTFFLEGVYAI